MSDQKTLPPISYRDYGASGPYVIVLHGGPGTPGYMAPLARALADGYHVIEPFQRGSGRVPLTVARHVEDTRALIDSCCRGRHPVVIGHSWGAMLALALAAAHPDCAAGIVLIGCGTFDAASRERLRDNLERRAGPGFSFEHLWDSLTLQCPDPDERLRIAGRSVLSLYSVDLLPHEDETEAYDARAFEESWADMLRLQSEGVYPAAFFGIHCPAIMFHGADDPHPGPMIFDHLRPFTPQLQYHEFARCGHYPWLERHAHSDFVMALRDWLALTASAGAC